MSIVTAALLYSLSWWLHRRRQVNHALLIQGFLTCGSGRDFNSTGLTSILALDEPEGAAFLAGCAPGIFSISGCGCALASGVNEITRMNTWDVSLLTDDAGTCGQTGTKFKTPECA